jgi:hypothetical protein
MIFGSRPDQRYSRQVEIGKCTFGRTDNKFRTSREKNNILYRIYWNTGQGADLKVVVVVVVVVVVRFMTVFVAPRNLAYFELRVMTISPL